MAPKNYGLITSVAELTKFVDKIIEQGVAFGIDIETGYTGEDRPSASIHPDYPESFIVGISFSGGTNWARYVPLAHGDFKENPHNLPQRECAEQFWRLVRTGRAVIHNAGFELRFMSRWFREQLGEAAGDGYFDFEADTMLEAYLYAGYESAALKALIRSIFGHEQAEITTLFPKTAKNKMKALRFNILELTEEVISYCCEDAAWCLQLHEFLYPAVKDMLLYSVEHKIVRILCDMEDYGLMYDWAAMRKKTEEAAIFLDKLNAEIQRDLTALTGRPQNVNLLSVVQLRAVLYGPPEEGGLGLHTTRATKTGGASTDEQALTGLAKRFPVVQKILDWKGLRKLLGTYLEKYEREYDYAEDGRTHPHHMQAVVPSGRFAVSDPPYQQSPKKYHYELDDGSIFDCDFRTFIIAPPDHYILGFDFSQVELRMLAGVSGEIALMHAFDNDEDVHVATAALMFGKHKDQVTKDERSKGKTLNFALLYGMGIKSLAERLGVDRNEAERLNSQYFAAYSSIQNWTERIQNEGRANACVFTPFGRKVTIWNYLKATEQWQLAEGDRLSVNAPIQGAAADYMKFAMIYAQRALAEAGLADRVHLVMNIHDALEYYVHKSVDPRIVVDLLAPKVSFPLPGFPKIVAEWHMGPSWGDVKELELVDGHMVVSEEAPALERYAPDNAEANATHAEARTESVTEGMPGTWSHCGNRETHGAHRHTVVMNEGPYPNVLCKGFPGDPAADAPAGEIVYQVGDCVTVGGMEFVKHSELPSSFNAPTQPAPVLEVQAQLPTSVDRFVRINLTTQPQPAQLQQFIQFLGQRPGNTVPVLVLPEGELPLPAYRTSVTPTDSPQVSMIFGQAVVCWDESSIDAAAMMEGITL